MCAAQSRVQTPSFSFSVSRVFYKVTYRWRSCAPCSAHVHAIYCAILKLMHQKESTTKGCVIVKEKTFRFWIFCQDAVMLEYFFYLCSNCLAMNPNYVLNIISNYSIRMNFLWITNQSPSNATYRPHRIFCYIKKERRIPYFTIIIT